MRHSILRLAAFSLPVLAVPPAVQAATYDVKSYGAVGDGKTIDTPAIDKAISDAADHGGGTVDFPAGTYASFTIHLRSNVVLRLEAGATLMAAEPPADGTGGYDPPEPNPGIDQYEDFGHSHYHNSLIVGEYVHDIGIVGPGRIYGFGLSRGSPSTLRDTTPEEAAAGIAAPPVGNRPIAKVTPGPFTYPSPKDTLASGVGNKSIALKNCRNILIQGITIQHGGHFGILATAADNMRIEGITIDTNRDGMDIDSCRNVSISDCFVNSPRDDGICLKSDYGLGYARACENIAITNCHVSGFDEGTFLAGTYERKIMGKRGGGTGRIKFGTESNGGFKNVAISNCTFNFCCGLALEEVDGGWLEDVTITNLTMRDIANSAIYVRLGGRNRGPAPIETGRLRRVTISNVVAYNVDPRYSSIISGVPGHDIEDLRLRDIRIYYKGGGTAKEASRNPPEDEQGYPEPGRLGVMPAYGIFIRHVRGIELGGIDLATIAPDARPPFVLDDVKDAEFDHVNAPHADGTPTFVLHGVSGLELEHCSGVADTHTSGPMPDGKL